MITIGELSRVSMVTIKTIRYYQDLGLIEPVETDPTTGYRYYNMDSYFKINSILKLKELGFKLKEIKDIFFQCSTDEDLDKFITSKIIDIKKEIKKLKEIERNLIMFDKNKIKTEVNSTEVNEIKFNAIVAAVKVNGKYNEIGKGFITLYKSIGKYIKGAPFGLYYDMEYKEDNPNFKAGVELKKEIKKDGIEILKFKEKKAVRIFHKGPYGTQGTSYGRLFEFCRKANLEPEIPIIERFIKGPGLIFKGNPENYITECIMIVK